MEILGVNMVFSLEASALKLHLVSLQDGLQEKDRLNFFHTNAH